MYKKFKLLIFLFALSTVSDWAGPPFNTDDPEPVDYLHWEFYLSSIMQFQSNESDLTLPHIEINYGAMPNLQIHLIAPLQYYHSVEGTSYGYGDTEFGIKYRFIQETEKTPQIGVFPLIEIPTGDQSKNLGNGKYQFYLPVWVQKSWGKLTTYGGAGYWINPGTGNKNWLFTGWLVQYDFTDYITLGGEIYYHTPDAEDSDAKAGFSIGGFFNLNEINHILFSIGATTNNEKAITAYLGYQVTI